MGRKVQLVLLCEDKQHEAFVRRFLSIAGWQNRRLRVNIAPQGEGSAEQFVREQFPKELTAYRANRNRVAQGLVVVMDGDGRGPDARLAELSSACESIDVLPRQAEDRVALIVPTWNIEAWLEYLSGTDVSEGNRHYPRLKRQRDCRPHVTTLYEMCRRDELRTPAPPSLETACREYRERLQF